jgi:hypothetical protein
MDRLINYPGAIPLETDLLNTNKNTMTAIAKVCSLLFGSTTFVNGLTAAPNGVPALNVVVSPGEIYSLQNMDGTAYSSLAADTTHQIVKQGIMLDAVTLATAAPVTGGQSINYLIQATFSEVDGAPVVLPYYNASNPAQAYSGPANAGTTNNTKRAGTVVVSAKAGIAATTGTQTTPAPDSGYVGLYVVVVANGQSTVTAPNISVAAGAPLIPAGGIIAGGFQSSAFNSATSGGTADALTGAFTPAITALTNGMAVYVRAGLANATTTPTFKADGTSLKTIVKGNGVALSAGDIAGAGHWLELQYDVTLDKYVLQNPATGVSAATAFATNAEAQAFAVTTKAISPATIAQAFKGTNQSLTTSGYQKLPGGLIVQWGSAVSASGAAVFTHPVAFPNNAFQITCSTSGGSYLASVSALSLSSSTATVYNSTNAVVTNGISVFFVVIGS